MFADSFPKRVVFVLFVLSAKSPAFAQDDDSTPLILGSIESEDGTAAGEDHGKTYSWPEASAFGS